MSKHIEWIGNILERNGFVKITENQYSGEKCYVTIHKDYYQVIHYEEAFLEHMDWFSTDLTIYTLMGYLSWNGFIERGYEK